MLNFSYKHALSAGEIALEIKSYLRFTYKASFLNKCNSSIFHFLCFDSRKLIIEALVSSMMSASICAKYICVVRSEVWPILSLITCIGTFIRFAVDAHEWRATYIVSGSGSFSFLPMAFNRLFCVCWLRLYC